MTSDTTAAKYRLQVPRSRGQDDPDEVGDLLLEKEQGAQRCDEEEGSGFPSPGRHAGQ